MPPGHPCRFPFPFPLFFFFVYPLLFVVLRTCSFSPFVLSFSVCFLYRLLRFSSRFPALRGGDYFILSRCYTPPPRCLRACKSVYSSCVVSSFFSCVLDFYLFHFSSLLSLFFDFDLDVVCFILIPSFLVCIFHDVFSVSVSLVCVFFTLNRPFYPSASTTPRVRADSSPGEIQALWSENHDTEILHCNAVSSVDNEMTCHFTGYDRYDIQMPAIQMR